MIKKTSVVLAGALVVFSFLPGAAWAQDASVDWQGALKNLGYGNFSDTRKGSSRIYAAEAPSGASFAAQLPDPLSVRDWNLVVGLYDRLVRWAGIGAAKWTFSTEGDQVRLLCLPSRVEYRGRDLLPNLPGGLSFASSGQEISYDFRVKSGDYFIRIQGQLVDEESLLNRLALAVDNPVIYIRNNDPSFLSARIDELRNQALAIVEQEKAAIGTLEQKNGELQGKLDALSSDQKASVDRIRVLEQENRDLSASRDKIAAAAVAALSKGLFSSPPPPGGKAIAKIVELKNGNPSLKAGDIAAALKKDGVQVSDKQVTAVLMVYLGVY